MPEQKGERGFEMHDPPHSPPGDAPAASFTFASLVLSLSTSALMHLGVAPRLEDESGSEPPEVDRDAARQVIDILEMLRGKTEGNLDADEQKMLEQVLHDLHMRYVQAGTAS